MLETSVSNLKHSCQTLRSINSGFSKEEAISLLHVSKPIGYIELNVEKCIPLSKTTSSVLMKYQDCDPSHLYIMHLFLNEIDNLSINYNDSEDTFIRTKTATRYRDWETLFYI